MSNWAELEKQAGVDNNFKSYAPNGEYKVKLDHVEVRDKDTWKAPGLEFHWAESPDYKFPKSITHWLSLANPAWRAVHNRNILMQFGVEKTKAEELIDAAEKNTDRAKLVQAYGALYKRVAERGSEVEITVHDQYDRNGNKAIAISKDGAKYTPSETDFKSSSCRMANAPKNNTVADTMGDGADINLDEMPF